MELRKVIVIGANPMGTAVAQWLAQRICLVEFVDSSSERLIEAVDLIHSSWDKLADEGELGREQVQWMKRGLKPGPLESVDTAPDLVIETSDGDLHLRKNLLQKLDYIFAMKSFIATVSPHASLPELSQALGQDRRPLFFGLHFTDLFSPTKKFKITPGPDMVATILAELNEWFMTTTRS